MKIPSLASLPGIPNAASAALLRVISVTLALMVPTGLATGTPSLASVTPGDGVTNVSLNSPLVFTFDQEMDTDVPAIMSFPPFIPNGNVEVFSHEILWISFEWSPDGRSLIGSFHENLPPNTTINWRLNPPGMIFPLKSAAGGNLPYTSGSFTTGGGVTVGDNPALIASNPANGDFDVRLDASISFTFDQPMNKIPNPGGLPPEFNGAVQWIGLEPANFTYSWNAEGTILTSHYSGDLPPLTTVFWSLNRSGATVLLESQNGEPLLSDVYAGMFSTTDDEYSDFCPDVDEATFGIQKAVFFEQRSQGDPIPDPFMPFLFQALVAGEEDGRVPLSGSLTLPGGAAIPLAQLPFTGLLVFQDMPDTLAELDSEYPAGAYLLKFTLSGEPEREIAMNLPPSHPPTPRFTQFTEAQNIDPTSDFTLRWNTFTGAGPNDRVSIFVMDDMGDILFPRDQCEPLLLPATATSVVIPADTLPSNRELEAVLGFGKVFYESATAVPGFEGYGVVTRVTSMPLAFGNGSGTGTPLVFSHLRLSATGNPELTVTGSPGSSHVIERSKDLSGSTPWLQVGQVDLGIEGSAVFEDTTFDGQFPVFYRALY